MTEMTGSSGAETSLLERCCRLLQEPCDLVWNLARIRLELTAQPEQSKPDPLDVGGFDGRDDLLGLLDKI